MNRIYGGAWVPSVPDSNLNHRDVCIDVGCDGVIDSPRNSEHKSALMNLLPRWDREAVFDGIHLEKHLNSLEQGCFYRPLFHHFALEDAVVVDRALQSLLLL